MNSVLRYENNQEDYGVNIQLSHSDNGGILKSPNGESSPQGSIRTTSVRYTNLTNHASPPQIDVVCNAQQVSSKQFRDQLMKDAHYRGESNGHSITPDFQATLQLDEVLRKPPSTRRRNDHHSFIPTAEFKDIGQIAELDCEGMSSFDKVLQRVVCEDSNVVSEGGGLNYNKEIYTPNLEETLKSRLSQYRSKSESRVEPDPFGTTEVFSWGADKQGQLGLGERFARGNRIYTVPKFCSYNIAITKIACGQEHSVFITKDLFVYSMGSNIKGQLGINDPKVKAKYSPVLVEALVGKRPRSVSCGNFHSVVLLKGYQMNTKQPHGEAYSWGDNQFGQTGGGGSAINSVDTVFSPRLVDFEAHFRPNISKISCGGKHTAFIDDIGRLFMCGDNKYGQLGVESFRQQSAPTLVTGISDTVSQVACGSYHSVVLTNKGHVWAMGSNKSGELGIGRKYDDQGAPVFLKELSFAKIVEIRSGSFTAALSTENQLYVWGRGVFGDFYTPHRVKSFKNHLISDFQISNFGFAIVLTKLGAVYSWGSNNYGQLGLSDQEIREKPQKVTLLENKKVEQISVGGGFVIALGQTEKLQNEIPKQASKSSISGASSDVNLKQNSSYYSTEQRHGKCQAGVQSKSKQKHKKRILLNQDSSNCVMSDDYGGTSDKHFTYHIRNGQRIRISNKIEKPKSFHNLHDRAYLSQINLKKKSKSSSKLQSSVANSKVGSSVPAVQNTKNKVRVTVNENIDDANTTNRSERQQEQCIQVEVPKVDKKKSRNQEEMRHTDSIRNANEKLKTTEKSMENVEKESKPEHMKEKSSRRSLAFSESETTFRGNKISSMQCIQIGQGANSGDIKGDQLKSSHQQSEKTDEPVPHTITETQQQESRNAFIRVQDFNSDKINEIKPFTKASTLDRVHQTEVSKKDEQEDDQHDGSPAKEVSEFHSMNLMMNSYDQNQTNAYDRTKLTASSNHESLVRTLMNERSALQAQLSNERDEKANLEAENKELRRQLETQADMSNRRHGNAEERHRDMVCELDRLRKANADLEERLDQQSAIKANLRNKIKELDGIYDSLVEKKNKAQQQEKLAIEEAAQFREDVSYLTKETEALLADVLDEQKLRKRAEKELEQLKDDFKDSQLQMEEEIRQLDKLRSKQEALERENDKVQSLCSELKTEKLEICHTLNQERDRLRDAQTQLQELQDSLPRKMEADKREIQTLKEQNDIQARNLRDLHNQLKQLQKLNSEQQSDLDDQRKIEKALRFENDSLDEYVRSLKNEVGELNYRQKELNEENRRLCAKLNQDIINRAGAYQASTLSILNGRQVERESQSQLSSIPGRMESAMESQNNTFIEQSRPNSSMILGQYRVAHTEEDDHSQIGSGLMLERKYARIEGEAEDMRKERENDERINLMLGRAAPTEKVGDRRYYENPLQVAPIVRAASRELTSKHARQKIGDENANIDTAPISISETPLNSHKREPNIYESNKDRIPKYRPSSAYQTTSIPPNQRKLSPHLTPISISKQHSYGGSKSNIPHSEYQSKPSDPPTRYQSQDVSRRPSLKTTGIHSLLQSRYEVESSRKQQRLEEQMKEQQQQNTTPSQDVKASLADLKSRLNQMRADRVIERNISEEETEIATQSERQEQQKQQSIQDKFLSRYVQRDEF